MHLLRRIASRSRIINSPLKAAFFTPKAFGLSIDVGIQTLHEIDEKKEEFCRGNEL
jgi:hypothetical protein